MAFEFTTTTEAIASKNYWPLQDMKQLVIYEAPLQSIDRSCLDIIQAKTKIIEQTSTDIVREIYSSIKHKI